jgi:hypothetical protein
MPILLATGVARHLLKLAFFALAERCWSITSIDNLQRDVDAAFLTT